ncbi:MULTISPECIES: hypothetical protein [unclassified Candidatus Tisiphia]|uniref:hypothetical protein n=2 Tax=Candidatus Tisiphia TaxID=2996317 RepID=UPI001E741E73|nr:MAG: hypothetical protein LF884_04435 [Rickettsia endosymbiont of Cimex lectularius]
MLHESILMFFQRWGNGLMLLRQSLQYPNKNAEISVSAAVWADKQLESHCQQFHSYQGASSSQHNASYETCPSTSDSEDDTALAETVKLHMCCEIM